MSGLTKKQASEREAGGRRLRDTAASLEAAVEEYNAAIESLKAPVEAALEAYNEALAAAADFAEGVVADAQSEWDDKSERWQESERGLAVQSWIQEWQALTLDEAAIHFPDNLEFPDLSAADEIDGLPDVPE